MSWFAIDKECSDWIQSDPDGFSKEIYRFVDFEGKKLTHWGIRFERVRPGVLVFSIVKGSSKKEWFVHNGKQIHVYRNLPGKGQNFFKSLAPVFEDTKNNFVGDFFRRFKRDKALESVLD